MAVKWETVHEGQTLWDVHKTKVGTRSETATWSVRIISIDHADDSAMVSWNGNPPQRYSRHKVEKLRPSPPQRK